MLPFELSAIDLILLIAVIILLILYITKPATKSSSIEEKFPSDKLAKTVTSLKTEGERPLSTQPQTDSPKCPYGFGYLKKLDKNAPIPNECLNCPRIMECFVSNE